MYNERSGTLRSAIFSNILIELWRPFLFSLTVELTSQQREVEGTVVDETVVEGIVVERPRMK